MDIVSRVQGILLRPKEEWVKIKQEAVTVPSLFTSYAMIVAAIPAAAQFIGLGLVGRRIPFVGWYRYGIGRAILYAIFSYILYLVAAYVAGIVINALAPTFSSTQNMTNAMKLSIFGFTPGWVGGIFYIIPFLGFLAIIAALYGIYILYLGFAATMMETPKEKILGYFIISIVVAIVLMVIISVVLGAIFAVGGAMHTI